MNGHVAKFSAFCLLLGLAACGGGGNLYPDGDVIEPPDFKLIKSDVKTSGGMIQSGTLEYEGQGDLVTLYREYIASMRSMGWARSSGQVNGAKAVAQLRKDTRTCDLNFIDSQGTIRASITISPMK